MLLTQPIGALMERKTTVDLRAVQQAKSYHMQNLPKREKVDKEKLEGFSGKEQYWIHFNRVEAPHWSPLSEQ